LQKDYITTSRNTVVMLKDTANQKTPGKIKEELKSVKTRQP